ncbi:MAG: hypothetical protein AAF387_11980, partial [Pseudomonadota bacterium]
PQSSKLKIEKIYCDQSDILTMLSTLRALVLHKSISAEAAQYTKLASLANVMESGEYVNVVWSAGDFEAQQARLCVESISKMIADLNQTTRAAGLPLGGEDGGISAQQVSSWSTGYPLRVSFAEGAAQYAPRLNHFEASLENNLIDCLVWIDAFGRQAPPDCPADVPTIFIGHTELARKVKADVVIPVGTPGIHHPAHLVRTDSVVTMPMERIIRSKLPSVNTVVDGLAAKLNSEGE